ncbi:hypothetical protein HELRODRAFT_189348 [Helobdella robusta]|uniref:Endonuclease/exonuclease/phosphatase domain-containing protein n=1 Tax=Helobdella robusta TaxID=6412 RepID=T1FQZ7_HELRO|nr:hypothetical protein HELRODRAFT_189348 [Helobdella robusta]ESN96731.1 hypothetical protein HELRODRAFT_189348 [Helobdella robusta]
MQALEQRPSRGGADWIFWYSPDVQQTVATYPPYKTSISRVFSPSEQTIPASLLRCLLLRAGIESNPGPPKIWICPICNMKINKTQYSARCRSCCNWCHLHDCSSDFGGFFICKNCPSPNPRSSSSAASAMSMRHSQTSSTFKTARIISHPAYQNTTGFVAHFPGQLTFLQWNSNGIKNKKDELQQHLETHKIHIAALQETKLTFRSKEPEFDGYSLYRKDRGLRQSESQAIFININNKDLTIINTYIPPQSVCPSHFTASISDLLSNPNTILMGDLNAHDSL